MINYANAFTTFGVALYISYVLTYEYVEYLEGNKSFPE